MRQAFVGPLPVKAFFKDFLPVEISSPSASPGFKSMAKAASEKDMYGFFVCSFAPLLLPIFLLQQAIQVDAVNALFTHFIAFNTSNTPSRELEAEYKPDVTIYKNDEKTPGRPFTSFQTMEMFVEFKHGNSSDLFGPKDNLVPKLSGTACASRGQIILYSIRQRAYQFRTSTLSVGIFGKVARLFRWDNTGCNVSEPIDYSTEEGNRQLVEFFLRFDRMVDDPEARGWDPTVCDATAAEVKAFAQAVEVASKEQHDPNRMRTRSQKGEVGPVLSGLIDSVGDPTKYARRKVSVMDGAAGKDYIVGRPTYVSKASTGRGTRGFVAMSVQTKALVFLKDSWRPDIDGFKPEDDWYETLLKECGDASMENVGPYSHGSDVSATRNLIKCETKTQRTIAHLYAKDHRRKEGMVGYIHHRVVLSKLLLPLEAFRDSKHLTSIMCDIAKGMFAWFSQYVPGIDFVQSPQLCTQGGIFPP